MTDTGMRAPDWYPDPFGRHELRYWDGSQWTEHIASHGRQGTDPPPAGGTSHVPTVNRATEKVLRDVEKAGLRGPNVVEGANQAGFGGGGGTLFTEPVLVVNQKAKLIEVTNEYAIFSEDGRPLGAVRQVGQSKARKVLRVVTSLDQFLSHRLEIVDTDGRLVLVLTRPAKVFKSRIVVEDAQGREIGQIVQQNMVGKINFGLHAGDREVGTIRAENWRAWNFSIADETGVEVARITKTWEGLARTVFTTADNYVVQLHRPLDEPLRSLVVASALGIDTALKQDARGLG